MNKTTHRPITASRWVFQSAHNAIWSHAPDGTLPDLEFVDLKTAVVHHESSGKTYEVSAEDALYILKHNVEPQELLHWIAAGNRSVTAGQTNKVPDDEKAHRKAEAQAALDEAYENLPEYNNGKTAAKKWAARKLEISLSELYRRLA